MRLEYYRLQKISEGSISLEGRRGASASTARPRSAAACVREQPVPLSQLIDVVNERFGTDFNQADQLFFDQIVEAAMTDDGLRQAAAVNPGDKFELVFRNLLEELFVERMDQNEEIFVRFMNDVPFQQSGDDVDGVRGVSATASSAADAGQETVAPYRRGFALSSPIPLSATSRACRSFRSRPPPAPLAIRSTSRRTASNGLPSTRGTACAPECSSRRWSASRWSQRFRTARIASSLRRSKELDRARPCSFSSATPPTLKPASATP